MRSFVQVAALSVTLGAAFFLARGALVLSPQIIAELATTKWGYNPAVVASLASQTADTQAGIVLLLIGFALQLWMAATPMRWIDFRVSRGGVAAGLVTALVTFAVAHCLSTAQARRMTAAAQAVVDEHLGQSR